MGAAAYRLDELGWLQFERLCALVLEQDAGLADATWLGHADRGRVAILDRDVVLERPAVRLRGPVAVVVVWVRPASSPTRRRADLFADAARVRRELGAWFERVLVLTNVDGIEAHRTLARGFEDVEELVMLGATELGYSLDRHPG